MRIALVAPPFIPVPPANYGGTELFIAHLAEGLQQRGQHVTVYANGESRVPCELRWRYRYAEWPIENHPGAQLKNIDHTAWAIRDAASHADIVHVNDAIALPFTTFVDLPAVVTLHHPHDPILSNLYGRYPGAHYCAISEAQARRELMPGIRVIYHGIPLSDYTFRACKNDYVVFLGRIAECKGPHTAIDVARRAGVRLQLAGDLQPINRCFWEEQVQPKLGQGVEYIGNVGAARKNELLSGARALLFPIEWQEPFGLVMIEAMACGTPVLAFAGGSVEEVVRDGVSGWICRDAADMAERLATLDIPADSCRSWVAEHFSLDRMIDRYLAMYEEALAGEIGSPVADDTAVEGGVGVGSE